MQPIAESRETGPLPTNDEFHGNVVGNQLFETGNGDAVILSRADSDPIPLVGRDRAAGGVKDLGP
jgi:hypothetical protein